MFEPRLIGSNETEQQFLRICLLPRLSKGTMLPFVHSHGNEPVLRASLKIISKKP